MDGDTMEKELEDYPVCLACNTKFIKDTLALNMSGMPVLICPNCRTLQIPKDVYDDIMSTKQSNIITPGRFA